MSLIDELVGKDEESVDAPPKIYGVVSGYVIDVLDPLGLGRVRLQIPHIDALDLSAWARVATIGGSLAAGVYWIPNPGDEVLVAFENGDLSAPYVLGSLWSAMTLPPLPSPVPQMRLIRTPLGNQIMFTEAPPSITITTASMTQSIVMTPAGIQIIAGTNMINMTPDGITIAGTPNVNITASGAIMIAAPTISINGATATNVLSGGACNVTAPLVKIN